MTVSPSRTNAISSSSFGRVVSLPDALSVKIRSTSMPSSCRTVFWSTVLTLPAQQRLYATLAGVNAVEVYDVTMGSPPTVTPAGRIPTSWWPSGVMIDQDGSLVVINGKGRGTGPELTKFGWSGGAITDRMAGSIQHVPAANLGALGPLTAITDENRRLGDAPGRSEVTCPGGAAYDVGAWELGAMDDVEPLEVVELRAIADRHPHPVAALDQQARDVRPDEPRRPRDEDRWHR